MVAAWISAETGVGPAIASPSQLCSGNCADLPQAASSSSRPIAVSAPSFALPAARVDRGEVDGAEGGEHQHDRQPSPMSPTRLTTNALLAAVA
jgi:hypothetical protein